MQFIIKEFENAAKLRDKEREVKIKLSQSSSEWEKYKIRDIVEVKEENIAEVNIKMDRNTCTKIK